LGDAQAAGAKPPRVSMILMFSPEHKFQTSLNNFYIIQVSSVIPSRVLSIHEISDNDEAKSTSEKPVVI
jgi:hypothetical protein